MNSMIISSTHCAVLTLVVMIGGAGLMQCDSLQAQQSISDQSAEVQAPTNGVNSAETSRAIIVRSGPTVSNSPNGTGSLPGKVQSNGEIQQYGPAAMYEESMSDDDVQSFLAAQEMIEQGVPSLESEPIDGKIHSDGKINEALKTEGLESISSITFQSGAKPNQKFPETKMFRSVAKQLPTILPKFVRWHPANLRYERPYFEDVMLERHGFSRGPIKQPFISGMHFYTTALLMPFAKFRFPPRDLHDHRAFGRSGSPVDR